MALKDLCENNQDSRRDVVDCVHKSHGDLRNQVKMLLNAFLAIKLNILWWYSPNIIMTLLKEWHWNYFFMARQDYLPKTDDDIYELNALNVYVYSMYKQNVCTKCPFYLMVTPHDIFRVITLKLLL